MDIFTCSPLPVRKLVQPCQSLGVARSGRELRYLPSESYLGQKEDDDDNDYYDLPVHLPMRGIVTPTSNCYESSLVGDCTGSISIVLKGKLPPTCN